MAARLTGIGRISALGAPPTAHAERERLAISGGVTIAVIIPGPPIGRPMAPIAKVGVKISPTLMSTSGLRPFASRTSPQGPTSHVLEGAAVGKRRTFAIRVMARPPAISANVGLNDEITATEIATTSRKTGRPIAWPTSRNRHVKSSARRFCNSPLARQ